MHNNSVSRAHGSIVAFALLLFGLINVFATTGIDRYEIYLNNKLLFKQSLDNTVNLYNLKLTEENADDQITIRYTQCNAPEKGIGRGRSISLRDNDGNIVKEWKFKDELSNEMTIPVKELLAYQKRGGELILYYAAEGLTKGQKLAALQNV